MRYALHIAVAVMVTVGAQGLRAQNEFDIPLRINMGGEETLVQLRQICDDVPILFVSGYSEQELVERGTNLNFNGFLKKPVRANALLEKIRTVCEG